MNRLCRNILAFALGVVLAAAGIKAFAMCTCTTTCSANTCTTTCIGECR